MFSESFHEGWKAYAVKNESFINSNGERTINPNEMLARFQNSDFYKILDGNEDDQASREEMEEYIDKGWVSDLGDGKEKEIKHQKWEDGKEKLDYVEKYNIDFVSKNFQDTIQNDNLPGGRFYETWLAQRLDSRLRGNDNIIRNNNIIRNDNVMELPEENHLTANGYANSWWIDVEEICGNQHTPADGHPSLEGNCIQNADGSYDFEMVVEFWPQRLFYIGLAISGLTLLGCLSYLWWTSRRRIAEFIKLSKFTLLNGLRNSPKSLEILFNRVNKVIEFVKSNPKSLEILFNGVHPVKYGRAVILSIIKLFNGVHPVKYGRAVILSIIKLFNRVKSFLKLRFRKKAEELNQVHPVKSDNVGILPQAELFNRVHPVKSRIAGATLSLFNRVNKVESVVDRAEIDMDFVKAKKEEIEQRLNNKFKDEMGMLWELGCLDADGAPNRDGILLFGKDPQKYYRNSYLTFTKYDASHNLEENINFKGSLPKIIEESYEAIKKFIPTKDIIDSDTASRKKVPGFPYVAVRELLINAVAHRDYEIGGSRIIVSMYEDKMEFQSPGNLPNGITPETILRSQYSRNPIIAEALFGLGYMEQLGSGIDRTFQLFKDLKKKKPKIENFENMAIVTIYSGK
ncbi:MAG: ATP-binding protein [Patescibacteria group bacterium]